jgi:phage shock protein PspC (stress-responsive transcriptional regulator)
MPSAPASSPPLRRTAGDRVVLGVCGGVAHTLGARPLLVRGGAVLLAAIAFPLVLAVYAAAALIVPRDDGRVLLGGEPADGREQLLGWTVVLSAGFLVLVDGSDPSQLVWPALDRGAMPFVVIAVAALLLREGRGGPAAPAVPGAQPPGTPPAGPASPADSQPAVPAHRPTGEEPTLVAATGPDAAPTAVHEPVPPAPPHKRRTGLLVAGTVALVLAALVTAGAVATAAIRDDGRVELRERTGAVASEYGLGVDSSVLDHLRSLARGPASLIGAGG